MLKIGTSSAIKTGLNKWNTLKVVVSGFTNYSFYINNSFMGSFLTTEEKVEKLAQVSRYTRSNRYE